MASRGHEVRLVTLGQVFPVEGIEVRTRPIPTTLVEAAKAAHAFLNDIHTFEPDLMHLHYAGGKLGTMATLSRVHPLVVTVMGGDVLPEQHPGGQSRLERRATRRVLEESDLILVKSDKLRPAMANYGNFSNKVETVRWGVDPDHYHPDPGGAQALRKRLGLSEEDRIVLSVRHIIPLYNVHLIVEAMPRVVESIPKACLLIAAYKVDSSYLQAIELQVERLGLRDRVRFIGQREQWEMPSLYSLAEVLVSIPSSDGLPQSLFEAMACRTPVVLGRLSAYEDVVKENESVLFVDFTPEAVAPSIIRLMSEPTLKGRIVAQAFETVREIASLPRDLERVELFYGALLETRLVRRSPRLVIDALSLLFR